MSATSIGKRPGRLTWPSTEAWLPRTCTTSMLTCGCFTKLPLRRPSAISFSAWLTVRPPSLHAAQQRVAHDAGFADAGFERQVGVLVDADAHHIAGAQAVFGGARRCWPGCRRAPRPAPMAHAAQHAEASRPTQAQTKRGGEVIIS